MRKISAAAVKAPTGVTAVPDQIDAEDLISGVGRPARSGPAMSQRARKLVMSEFYNSPSLVSPRVGVIDGGVDHSGSPYLAFVLADREDIVYLAERPNDDGYLEPQFYMHDSGNPLNPFDTSHENRIRLLWEVDNIRVDDEVATPAQLIEVGLLREGANEAEFADFRWRLLYGFRDYISSVDELS